MQRDQLFGEGDYDSNPESIRYTESSKKGTPAMEVIFNVSGHKKKVMLWLSDAAQARTLTALGTLGFNGDFAAPTIDSTLTVQVTCKHAEYPPGSGSWKEEWTYWPQPVVNLDRSAAAKYSALYKSTTPAAPKPARKPTPPPAAKPVAPKPPAPRPSAPAPEEKPVVAKDSDSAWAYWCKQVADDDERSNNWTETISNMGKPEASFTADDWNKVALAADIPF